MNPMKDKFWDYLKTFRTYCSINPPYYILVDACFICALITNGMFDISSTFRKRFGSRCKIYTTKCVRASLEKDFPGNRQIATMLEQILDLPCRHPHQRKVHPFCCILKISCLNHVKSPRRPPRGRRFVVSDKEALFTIATQDPHLSETITEKVIGVPLLRIERGRLVLDKPSKLTLTWIQNKQHMKAEKFAVALNIHDQQNAEQRASQKTQKGSESVAIEVDAVTAATGLDGQAVPAPGSSRDSRPIDLTRKQLQRKSPDIADVQRKALDTQIFEYKCKLDKLCKVPKGVDLQQFKPLLTMFDEFKCSK